MMYNKDMIGQGNEGGLALASDPRGKKIVNTPAKEAEKKEDVKEIVGGLYTRVLSQLFQPLQEVDSRLQNYCLENNTTQSVIDLTKFSEKTKNFRSQLARRS